MRRSLPFALAAAALLCGAEPRVAAEDRPRRGHAVVLWSFDDDAAAPGFAAAAQDLGATAVQARSDDDVARLRAAGLSWYEDHAAGKGVLGLRDDAWRPRWEKVWEARKDPWPPEDVRARPSCLRDPEVRASMASKVAAAARRAKDGALWVSLEDEPASAVRANPLDWCLCERCCAAFRGAARKEFASVADLNRAWGTRFRSFDEVRPATIAETRAACYDADESEWRLGRWFATRRFQDRSFAEAVGELVAASRREAPRTPVGLTGTQFPSAFGGFDYAALAAAGMDFAEPYDAGVATAVARDLLPAASLVAQTVFPSDDLRVSRWRMWRGIARGADASIVWSSRDALSRSGAAFARTPFGDALRDDLRRLSEPGGLGERLAAAATFDEGIRVVVSMPSIQARWLLDSREDGFTWPRRFGSHEAAHSTAIASRNAAWAALSGRGARFVDAGAVPAAAKDAKLLVLPDVIAADPEAFRGIDAARIVADADVRFDASGRGHAPRAAGRTDRGFARLAQTAEQLLGPPPLRVRLADERGKPIPCEVALRVAADRVYAICVGGWDVPSGDDGSARGGIPAARVTWTFSSGDGRTPSLRDELAARDLPRPVVTADAAEPVVVSFPR
ncbi:MAG: hypothetical protein HMLKMBBP_03596 [Planctomycetes bacterium]|nr:hypothetical protein [Planctomycetota bacterium]